MAYSFIASVSVGSSGGLSVTTGSINTAGATILTVVVADYQGLTGVSTVSDSKSNTWTKRTPVQNSTADRVVIWDAKNPTVGSGHTFTVTVTVSSTFPSICAMAFSGANTTSPFDVENQNTQDSGTSVTTGSITPSQNNELVVAGLSIGATRTASIDSGFTLQEQVSYSATNHIGAAFAYKIQTSAAAVNPTWSWTTATDAAADIASYKAAVSPVVFRKTLSGIGSRTGSRQVHGWSSAPYQQDRKTGLWLR